MPGGIVGLVSENRRRSKPSAGRSGSIKKTAPKAAKKPAAKKPAAKRPKRQKPAAKKAVASKEPRQARVFHVDLSGFPVESIASSTRSLCVACVWQIFTQALNLAPKTALAEIKRYTPSFEELTSAEAVRPFFQAPDKDAAQGKVPCPYCGSPREMACAH